MKRGALVLTLIGVGLLSFSACKTLKKPQEAEEAVEAVGTAAEEPAVEVAVTEEAVVDEGIESVATPYTFDGLGQSLVLELKGLPSSIQQFYPDVAFAKTLSPKETAGMSDDEVISKLLGPLETRLTQNLDNIKADAKQKNIDLGSIKFESVEHTETDDPPSVPRVVLVAIGNEKWRANVPVTYVRTEGKIFIFEILISTNLFKERS